MKSLTGILVLTLCISYNNVLISQIYYNKEELQKMTEFNKKMKTDRLIVSIQDSVVSDKLYRGSREDLYHIYSITKVFSGIAIGILIDQKKIESPEVKISQYFEEWRSDPKKEKITIRHILQHLSGIKANKGSKDIYSQNDYVQFALNSEVVTEPGFEYFYNNKAINIISGLVGKVSGKSLELFIKEFVFDPLDIKNYAWKKDNSGNTWGMDGLQICAHDLLKTGQMLNNGGTFQGKRILSENWVKMMFQLPLMNFAKGIGGYGMTISPKFISEKIHISSYSRKLLKEAGLRQELIHKIEKMHPDSTYTYGQFGSKLKENFNWDEIEELTAFGSKNLIPLYTIANENYVVMHGGEYGLLLAVFLKKKTVLVRYLGEKHGRKKGKNGAEYKYLIDGQLLSSMININY